MAKRPFPLAIRLIFCCWRKHSIIHNCNWLNGRSNNTERITWSEHSSIQIKSKLTEHAILARSWATLLAYLCMNLTDQFEWSWSSFLMSRIIGLIIEGGLSRVLDHWTTTWQSPSKIIELRSILAELIKPCLRAKTSAMMGDEIVALLKQKEARI